MVPPRSEDEYKDTSVTGLTDQIREAALELADRQRRYPRDVFTDAIYRLIDQIRAGQKVDWEKVIPGTGKRPYHVRLRIETLADLRDVCDTHKVRKSAFFLTALAQYLRAHGYTIDT